MKTDGPRGLLALLALVSVLPNLRAAIPGLTYFFRDFSLTYYPLRCFYAREVAAGRWPFWNPYVHEGCAFLPVFYPLETVQAFWSGPSAVSWLLTVHFPLAALAMYALARDLGAGRWGAFVSGAVYSMGGLCLSSLNLHWFLQALALAPLLAAVCVRAADRGGRSIVGAALVLGLSVSTLAVEFVAQGLLLGLALGLVGMAPRTPGPSGPVLLRLATALALGVGLAALPAALVLGIMAESVRGAGFPAVQALQNAVPPVTLLQVLIPDLFGSVSEPLRSWWGGRLFEQGSPYFMSLYLGPLALACAAAGLAGIEPRCRRVLVVAGLMGLWYSLGRPAGLAPLLAPALKWFRYPSKALLLPYMVLALLAGRGVERLRSGSGWRGFGTAAGVAGMAAGAVALSVLLTGPALAEWLDISPWATAVMRRALLLESGTAVLVVLVGLGLAWAVRSGKTSHARAGGLLTALLVADLWRGGIGLNPQVSLAFFEPLPEMAAEHLDALEGGRVFSYGADRSPALKTFLQTRGPGVDLGGFFVARQLLDPYNNIVDSVESAEAKDRLSFIGRPPALAPQEHDPALVGGILTRLRNAAVVRVLSLDVLDHPDLRLRTTIPAGSTGLDIRVYELLHPWPRAYLACRALAGDRAEALAGPLDPGFDPFRDVVLEEPGAATCGRGSVRRRTVMAGEETYDVEGDGQGYVVMRDSFAKGWSATVDGGAARVLRANGKHRAVPVPAGRHRVVLRYDPPGLRPGLLVTVLSALGSLVLLVRPVFRGEGPGAMTR